MLKLNPLKVKEISSNRLSAKIVFSLLIVFPEICGDKFKGCHHEILAHACLHARELLIQLIKQHYLPSLWNVRWISWTLCRPSRFCHPPPPEHRVAAKEICHVQGLQCCVLQGLRVSNYLGPPKFVNTCKWDPKKNIVCEACGQTFPLPVCPLLRILFVQKFAASQSPALSFIFLQLSCCCFFNTPHSLSTRMARSIAFVDIPKVSTPVIVFGKLDEEQISFYRAQREVFVQII